LKQPIDELGLTLENSFLTVYMPAPAKALVFRVISRTNKGYEKLPYGALPLDSGTTVGTLDGGTTTVPADGVLPSRSYTISGIMWESIISGVYDSTDMWFIPKDWREMLFEIILDLMPKTLRVGLEIPKGTKQPYFQRTRVALDVSKDWGWQRGRIEVIQFPGIHYGYLFCNDLNAAVYTSAVFTYAENVVEIPEDPELIFRILTREVPSKWITLPIKAYTADIKARLTEVYGFDGFPIYGIHQKEKAVEEYRSLLKEALI